MNQYTLTIEKQNLQAFSAACDRLIIKIRGIKEITISDDEYLDIAIIAPKPETLFALGNQYHFYKGVNLKIKA